ncbi:hypothetical protein [uncultured Dubosiella sp.]|uniref:hypothetical protein n=1 Tax=uncultured Dubosiella sp. TaxID=1937011 RepID=UPI002731EB7D|nr:hypothetical protein [uncultured Dubosiella sp.]
MKSVDLSGKKFGKLTVIQKTDTKRKGSYLWLCQCECGQTILLESYKIRRELVKSCGCSRKGKNTKDLTKKKPVSSCGCVRAGAIKNIAKQRFGKLTALRPTTKRKGGSVVWTCLCDCGRTTEASYNDLVSGNTRSCGCLIHEKGRPGLSYVDQTCIESLKSKALHKNNTSGYTGVQKQRGKWVALISLKKHRYYLGTYERFEDAVFVRQRAEQLLHDQFVQAYESWNKKDETWKQEHPLKIVVKGTNIDDFELEVEESDRGNHEKKRKRKQTAGHAHPGRVGERKRSSPAQ